MCDVAPKVGVLAAEITPIFNRLRRARGVLTSCMLQPQQTQDGPNTGECQPVMLKKRWTEHGGMSTRVVDYPPPSTAHGTTVRNNSSKYSPDAIPWPGHIRVYDVLARQAGVLQRTK